jgi:hypothetical protein
VLEKLALWFPTSSLSPLGSQKISSQAYPYFLPSGRRLENTSWLKKKTEK